MLKRSVLLLVVLAALLTSVSPAMALQYALTLYVDTAYTGTEYGTPTQPYNTLEEAIAVAQGAPYGGYIYTKQSDGTWLYYGYIASVYPGDTGTPLSEPALIALLAAGSLVLVVAGWFLMRRSRTQRLTAS